MCFVKGRENIALPVSGAAAVNPTGLYIKMGLDGAGWRSL
jgi:LysR family transcriptional regulator, regulator for bpeEF and oprC